MDAKPPAHWLMVAEVADVLRVPIATLRYWRHRSTGPRSFRVGRGVRYWRSEVSGSGELDARQCHHRDVACLGSTKARRWTTS